MQEENNRLTLQCLKRLLKNEVADIPASKVSELFFDFASRQGVSALVWDSFSEATTVSIPRELRLRWACNVLNTEDTYQQQLHAAHKLSEYYRTSGIKTVVFKGLPLSSCYPIPKHRPCGDIDCWLCGDFAEGNRLIASLGIPVDYENPKHAVFSYKKTTIENHGTFLDTTQYRIDRILNDFLEQEIARKGLYEDPETKLLTFTPTAHALFLLRHTARHLTTKISLRHICDWAFFVQKFSAEIDWDRLIPIMEQTKLMTFFNIQNGIAVDDLGLDESLLPRFNRNLQLQQRVLEDLFQYGTDKIRTKNPILIFVQKIRRILRQRWKTQQVLHASFAYTLWRSFCLHLQKLSQIFRKDN